MGTSDALQDGITSEVVLLLRERPGAEYLRADLQVHTPIDPAFEPRPEPRDPVERRQLAMRYLGKAKERGIELVGITEHNDVSWIQELRDAAAELGLYLLPGFEVESAEGVHVLCLFDSDTSVSHLEDSLVQLGLTAARPSAVGSTGRPERSMAWQARWPTCARGQGASARRDGRLPPQRR